MMPWAEVVPRLRERAYGHLDNDPQILLERDAYFTVDADLFHARLIGFEDEIVRELWIRRVEPIVLLPIHSRLTVRKDPVDPWEIEPIRTARYVLQSGFATLSVDGMYSPPVEQLRPDNTAKLCFLRYKRRS